MEGFMIRIMKGKSVLLITVLFSLALVGVLYSQFMWIKKAVQLKEEQFDHRIDMALNDIVDEYERYQDTSFNILHMVIAHDNDEHSTILDVVNPKVLDSLLTKYTQYHNVQTAYEFAIVKTNDGTPVFASSGFKSVDGLKRYKVCLSCLWQKEIYHLAVIFPERSKYLFFGFSKWVILSTLFILIVVASFWYTVHTFVKQKKVSQIKNDFVNNMTHEFKTPISTIQLTGEMLLKKLKKVDDTSVHRYIEIILKENVRMRSQVEKILQMAVMEKEEFHLNKERFDLHELITNTVDNLCLDFCEANADIKYNLNASEPLVFADQVHVTNIILNLVQNSIKYSTEIPQVTISSRNIADKIEVSIEDKGIGMKQDQLKHIFDKFYRISTGDVHNVKGFGIGLFYVKTMLEAHGGSIKVESQLNKGSSFIVLLPINNPT